MAAYLIARVHVTNPEAYEGYKKLAAEAIAKYDGRYLARGGRMVTLEGDEETARVVIVAFPSLEQAKKFYDSPEYQEAKAAREGAATGHFVVVEGVAPE
ncbi:MAG: DUF1330 domain-containing protein [Acidobacteria bacterium]|nr:MAG: DUF1330 domain-containing protein [Acidobacteriota bacterium]